MHIKNIHYQYPDSGFSIEINDIAIEEGKAYLLLGLNGSGKTTLLSVLSGFLPSEKMILPSGFHSYLHSYGWAGKIKLSVKDFFKQTLILLNRPISDLDHLLKNIGLEEIKNQKLMSLSSGQLQRCLTEIAFLQNASLLLFDEPTNALDFVNRDLFISKTKQSLSEGKHIIATSHIDSIIDIDFEAVLILNKGKLIANEKIATLKSRDLTYKEFYETTMRYA